MTSKCSFNMWSSDRDDKAQNIPFSLMASISRFFASSLSFPSGLLRVKRQAANSRLGFLGKPSSSRFSTGILTLNQKDLSRSFVCLNGGLATWPLVLGGLAFDSPLCVSQVTQAQFKMIKIWVSKLNNLHSFEEFYFFKFFFLFHVRLPVMVYGQI